jgi:hypothetical protein
MSRVHFFATAADIAMICQIVESKLDLKILPEFRVPKEEFTGEVTEYQSFADIPSLGHASTGIFGVSQSYLLIEKEIPVLPGTHHGTLHGQIREEIYISATLNEAAVEFRPAGEFGGDAVLMGEVMSHLASKKSERIVRAFRTAMKKHFGVKAGAEWIGPEALERLKAGTRVTAFYDHAKPEIADVQLSEIEPKEAIASG